MVAVEPSAVSEAHDPQGSSHCPFSGSENRAREQHLGMRPYAFGKNSGANGLSRCSILVGRVCIAASPGRLATSIPYPSRLPKWLKSSSGTPKNAERDKHSDLRWFGLDDLADDVTLTTRRAVELLVSHRA